MLSKDLIKELKSKEEKLEKFKNRINEFTKNKTAMDSQLEERDEQIANLFRENLIIQKCKEEVDSVISYNKNLKNSNADLIVKNKQLCNELKEIKNKLVEKIIDIKEIPESKREIDAEKILNENSLLKQALVKEQSIRIAKTKAIIVLEEKLTKLENEIKKCESIRYRLSIDIQTLQSNFQKLTVKFNEQERINQIYLNFVTENKLIESYP